MNLKNSIDNCTYLIKKEIEKLGLSHDCHFYLKEGLRVVEELYIKHGDMDVIDMREHVRAHLLTFVSSELS